MPDSILPFSCSPRLREFRLSSTSKDTREVVPDRRGNDLEEAFQIPRHWPRICGKDFGWGITRPLLCGWLGTVTPTWCTSPTFTVASEQTAVVHSSSIKARAGGDWIPIAWPHDDLQTEKSGGETLAAQYKKLGLRMLSEHASFTDGGNSVEAGVAEMIARMQTGRLIVASHLNDWWEEFRLYHRDNGRIVKEFDDALCATRYGLMMLRSARTQPDFSQGRVRMAGGLDYDPMNPSGSAQSSGLHTAGNPGVVWGNGRPAHLEAGNRKRSPRASGTDFDIFS